MKDIKRPGVKTQEGFELRNLKRFPSMEWGDEGGMQVDIYYNNQKLLQVFQEGNGGPAITYTEDYYREHAMEMNILCLKALCRTSKCYGPNSPYSWLRNKTAQKINDEDWEALANALEERYDDLVVAGEAFRKGYKAVVAMKNDYETRYLNATAPINEEYVKTYMAKNNLAQKYSDFIILNADASITTI